MCAALLLSPCGPAAQRGCWHSPPPASGNVWRRACGNRSSRPAPSRQRWQWPCRHMWLCPFLRAVYSRMVTRHQNKSCRTELPLLSTAVRKMVERAATNLPNSSRSTRECLVAWCRMLAVSLSSTKKVLSPGQHMMDNTGLARKGGKKSTR